jgi:hypothetical protein
MLILASAGCGLTGNPDRPNDPESDPVTGLTHHDDEAGLAKLDEIGQQLHTVIRELAGHYPDVDPRQLAGPNNTSCKDMVGNDPWPQQAGSDISIFVGNDTRPQARETAERLRQEGWTIEDHGDRIDGPGSQGYQARRDGFFIQIIGGIADPDTSLVIMGITPCVNKDGTLAK